MPMTQMTNDGLMRVARMYSDVEPPADLETRIKRRLDDVTRPDTVRRWPWVAGLAAAGALVIVVAQYRPAEVPESRPFRVAELGKADVPVPNEPELAPTTVRTPEPIQLPPYRSPSVEEWAWMSRRMPQLEPLDPLTIEHVVLDAIQPDPIRITPLTITPLGSPLVQGDSPEGRQ